MKVYNIYHNDDWVEDENVQGAYWGASDWFTKKEARDYIKKHNLKNAEIIDMTEERGEMDATLKYELDRTAGRDCTWFGS